MIVGGFHAIEEAIRSDPRRIEWVLFDSQRRDRRSGELKQLCREKGVSVRFGPRQTLDRQASHHQGVVARIAAAALAAPEDAFSGKDGQRLLLALDSIQDPHNLGAILRVSDALGARVVVPERGSAPLSETVARISAGAMQRVPIHRAVNLRRFVDEARERGFLAVGLDERGEDFYRLDLARDILLVLGSEGRGLRRLVREGCDVVASLPMAGSLSSLNVSTAAAAAGFEVIRQRTKVLA